MLPLYLSAACFYFFYKLLEFFPSLVWKPCTTLGRRGRVKRIAHRGSRGEGLPENTRAAFRDACEAGAEVLELDVWILRDGQVVVFHDPELTRMTGGACTRNIIDFKYSELPELSPNDPEWDMSSRTSLYPFDECFKIPLLEDVFKVVPKETVFIIEFKQDSAQLISEVHKIVKHAERHDNILWFSLKEKINKNLRKFDPEIPTLTSVDEMLKIIMAYYCGVMPYIAIPDKVFGITLDAIPLERIQMNLPNSPHWLHVLLSILLHGTPPAMLLVPKLFAYLRRRGFPIWFLSVNSVEELKLAESMGATGVLSDHPLWLKNAMKEHNIQLATT